MCASEQCSPSPAIVRSARDRIQPLNQARAAAAGQRAQEGFWPDTPEGSNSHVIVRLRPAAL